MKIINDTINQRKPRMLFVHLGPLSTGEVAKLERSRMKRQGMEYHHQRPSRARLYRQHARTHKSKIRVDMDSTDVLEQTDVAILTRRHTLLRERRPPEATLRAREAPAQQRD